MASVELSSSLRWPDRRETVSVAIDLTMERPARGMLPGAAFTRHALVAYRILGRQSGPCLMPPPRGTGRGSTQWSAGCGGGRPASPAPPPSQTCQQHDSTVLESPQTGPGHGTPDMHSPQGRQGNQCMCVCVCVYI